MPIDPKDVRVGHCYATPGDRHRKVTAVVDGRVHYDTWEGGAGNPPSPGPAGGDAPSLETFAGAVEREVPCPDVAGAKPSKAEG